MTTPSTAPGRPLSFALATPHTLATEAGEEAIRDGGNAVDAAVAAAVALTVVYPHQCAVGGDLIALLATPDGHVVSVNGSGAAAGAATLDDLGDLGHPPVTGPLSVTVPGAVAGWASLSRAAGRLPFGRLFGRAVGYAREGVPTAPGVAHALTEEPDLLASDEGLRQVFFPDGQPLHAGQTLRQPALARTLTALADDGEDAFYRGPLGASVVRHLRALGSRLSTDDLARHRTDLTAPVSRTFRGEEYLTAPPNSQGLHLLQILSAVEHLDPTLDLQGADASVLARVFQRVARDRDTHLADPRHASVPVDDLLSASHTARIAEWATEPAGRSEAVSPGVAAQAARPSGDTVAVVAADSEGNVVSVIQSLFHGFGSGILEPTTGILLHNRGSFFSAHPDAPNRLRGGSRPAHTLMPVLTRRGGTVTGAHGTMGGKAQPQIHAHLALRLTGGDSAVRALRRARWVVGGMEVDAPADVGYAESDVPVEARTSLRHAGLDVRVGDTFDEEVGHGQLVRLTEDGGLHAASDPRSDGSAVSHPAAT